MVIKKTLALVTTVADELEKDFTQYYNQVMPVMKCLITEMINDEDRVLVGKMVECVTAIGTGVGKDKVSTKLM